MCLCAACAILAVCVFWSWKCLLLFYCLSPKQFAPDLPPRSAHMIARVNRPASSRNGRSQHVQCSLLYYTVGSFGRVFYSASLSQGSVVVWNSVSLCIYIPRISLLYDWGRGHLITSTTPQTSECPHHPVPHHWPWQYWCTHQRPAGD